MKAFVTLTEGFYSRQQISRNAVLVNVIGRANLGHCPQEMIADDMAQRFGGLSDDFHVGRYRERDFVIFLPHWVRPESLTTREVVRLRHCQLRCYEWKPYRNAQRSQLSYKAWVKLINLPFECWSEYRVAAIVNGFGRYLRGDADSLNMRDLIGFRCQIAVDDLADIPESMLLTLGDITITVTIRLERSAPFGGDDRGTPFVGGDQIEGGDQTDPLGRRLARRVNTQGMDPRGNSSTEGDATGHGDTWNATELRDRRCRSGVDPAADQETAVKPSATQHGTKRP